MISKFAQARERIHQRPPQLPIEARGLPLLSKLDDLALVVDTVRVVMLETP
jgi:hypothetical protein